MFCISLKKFKKNKSKFLISKGEKMKRGLGKGLDALFSIFEEDQTQEEDKKVIEKKIEDKNQVTQTKQEEVEVSSGVKEIDIRLIDPNKNQPRKRFDANSLRELAESIKLHGIIQPIIVNKENNGRFTIIAGERRFRASISIGLKTIPAIIREYSPRQVKEISLIENLQREDLNPIESAKAIKELMIEFGFTQEIIADRIGKSRPLVANTLRLLNLCPEVINLIETNQLSAGHGKCLVAIEDTKKQLELAQYVIQNKLTVRDLELIIKNGANIPSKNQKAEKFIQTVELKELGHRMQRLFRTKVKIIGDDNKGKISIAYFNPDDLDRICSFIDKLERN